MLHMYQWSIRDVIAWGSHHQGRTADLDRLGASFTLILVLWRYNLMFGLGQLDCVRLQHSISNPWYQSGLEKTSLEEIGSCALITYTSSKVQSRTIQHAAIWIRCGFGRGCSGRLSWRLRFRHNYGAAGYGRAQCLVVPLIPSTITPGRLHGSGDLVLSSISVTSSSSS